MTNVKSMKMLKSGLLNFRDKHSSTPKDLTSNFAILKKCNSKFDCLIYEMFYINELRQILMYNVTQFMQKCFKQFYFCMAFIVFNSPLFNIFMFFTFVTSLSLSYPDSFYCRISTVSLMHSSAFLTF